MLVEGFQRAFAADGIAEEHGYKVNDLLVAEAAASKAHPLSDGGRDILLPKIVHDQDDFSEPSWRRGNRLRRGLDGDG